MLCSARRLNVKQKTPVTRGIFVTEFKKIDRLKIDRSRYGLLNCAQIKPRRLHVHNFFIIVLKIIILAFEITNNNHV